LLDVVLFAKDKMPNPVLYVPDVLSNKEPAPKAVLLDAVLAPREASPTAVLEIPVTLASNAPAPIAVLFYPVVFAASDK